MSLIYDALRATAGNAPDATPRATPARRVGARMGVWLIFGAALAVGALGVFLVMTLGNGQRRAAAGSAPASASVAAPATAATRAESTAPAVAQSASESVPETSPESASEPAPISHLDDLPVLASAQPQNTPQAPFAPPPTAMQSSNPAPDNTTVATATTNATPPTPAVAISMATAATRADAIPSPTPTPALAPAPATAPPATTAPEPSAIRITVTSVAEQEKADRKAARANGDPDPAAVRGAMARLQSANDEQAREQAVAELQGLLPADSLTLLRARAWAAHENGDIAQAQRLYQNILQRVPDDEYAGVNLALIDARHGDIAQARERLSRLAARNGRSPMVERALAELENARQ